jgi:hypothetical protein
MVQVAEPPPPAIIVRIIEPPRDPTGGLGDLLLSALGLTGAIIIIAVACGLLIGGLLFWRRRRADDSATVRLSD